jgi:hypothetical protein
MLTRGPDMVLEDVTELCVQSVWLPQVQSTDYNQRGSDYSGTNTKLSKILLNGNNICMVNISLSRNSQSYLNLCHLAYSRRRRSRSIRGFIVRDRTPFLKYMIQM